MDPGDVYAWAILQRAGIVRAPCGVPAIARGLGISLWHDHDHYDSHADAGLLTTPSGENVVWTAPWLSPARRSDLQMCVIVEWYLTKEGMRACTAAVMARPIAARVLMPSTRLRRLVFAAAMDPAARQILESALKLEMPRLCVASRIDAMLLDMPHMARRLREVPLDRRAPPAHGHDDYESGIICLDESADTEPESETGCG